MGKLILPILIRFLVIAGILAIILIFVFLNSPKNKKDRGPVKPPFSVEKPIKVKDPKPTLVKDKMGLVHDVDITPSLFSSKRIPDRLEVRIYLSEEAKKLWHVYKVDMEENGKLVTSDDHNRVLPPALMVRYPSGEEVYKDCSGWALNRLQPGAQYKIRIYMIPNEGVSDKDIGKNEPFIQVFISARDNWENENSSD